MSKHTSPKQRRAFYQQHQVGQTYQEIADEYSVSKEWFGTGDADSGTVVAVRRSTSGQRRVS